MEYNPNFLNNKIFKYLGTFKTATILKTRNNDSWGDSALICTSRDMLSFAKLLMNNGEWNGRQLINKDYVKKATSFQIDNNITGFSSYDNQGYGYQIWQNFNGGFSFNGMGSQFTLCVPNKDFIFICTGDNQGYNGAHAIIFALLNSLIIDEIKDNSIEENDLDYKHYLEQTNDLKLAHQTSRVQGNPNAVNDIKFICEDNAANIKWFKFVFNDNKVKMIYENKQGEKTIEFGLGYNIFSKFPELGYSNDHGGLRTNDGFMYDCANSAGWRENNKLLLRVQVIDRYFGNFNANVTFKNEYAVMKIESHAEDFFKEYDGVIVAKR